MVLSDVSDGVKGAVKKKEGLPGDGRKARGVISMRLMKKNQGRRKSR